MVSRILVGRKSFLVLIFFFFWSWNGILFSSWCRKRLLSWLFQGSPSAHHEKNTREAFFYISRRKEYHFNSRKKNCHQKIFSVHLNSTTHHENSYLYSSLDLRNFILKDKFTLIIRTITIWWGDYLNTES